LPLLDGLLRQVHFKDRLKARFGAIRGDWILAGKGDPNASPQLRINSHGPDDTKSAPSNEVNMGSVIS